MCTILIVDDMETNRRLVATVLRNAGYRIQSASDGLEALEIIAQNRPDVVLLDLNMPRMNGWELSRCLKTDREWRTIPIIALTGWISPYDEEQFIGAEWAGYIRKPFDIAQLVSTVDQVVVQR